MARKYAVKAGSDSLKAIMEAGNFAWVNISMAIPELPFQGWL